MKRRSGVMRAVTTSPTFARKKREARANAASTASRSSAALPGNACQYTRASDTSLVTSTSVITTKRRSASRVSRCSASAMTSRTWLCRRSVR
jgi:hypothetical protein